MGQRNMCALTGEISSGQDAVDQDSNITALLLRGSKPGQIFDIAVGSLNGRLNEAVNAPVLFVRPAEEIFQHGTTNGRIPDNSPFADRFRPGLELGLNQGDNIGVSAQPFSDSRKDQLERNERNIDDHQTNRLKQRIQIASVGPFHDDDPFILAELPDQLPLPHVDGIDTGRATLQQDVGEAAGTRADIGRDPIGHIKPELFQRAGQLMGAASSICTLREI